MATTWNGTPYYTIHLINPDSINERDEVIGFLEKEEDTLTVHKAQMARIARELQYLQSYWQEREAENA